MHRTDLKFNIMRLLSVLMICSVLLPLCFLSVSAEEEDVTSGKCGPTLEWSFDTGTLTISGSGAMTNFTEPEMAPWYHLRDKIRRIVLPDGLTSIGGLAFFNCKNLSAAVIPSSVKTIGYYAFSGCESLSMLKFGGSETEIKNAAFYGCTSLDAVRLPYSLQKLGSQAFYRCESLSTVTIQSNLEEMGGSVFAYCKNLVSVFINARIKVVPDWTFYGCELLSSVVFPDTVVEIEDYAFKFCGSLSTVYYDGEAISSEDIKQTIAADIPGFEGYGHVTQGRPNPTVTSGRTTENEDGGFTQENLTVKQDDNMTVVTVIENTYAPDSSIGMNYVAQIAVTIENKDGWQDALTVVKESLKTVNGIKTENSEDNSLSITVYMKDSTAPDASFLEDLAGRELEVTVVAPNGSSWQIDCEHITKTPEEVAPNDRPVYDYSFEIEDASEESKEKLGTEDCFGLTFSQSGTVNTELLVQLPESTQSLSNAYLYQVEKDGTHTKVQGVKVDQNSVAHFYVGSVDNEVDYVIALNVPGESTEDLIIPDELNSQYGNALMRLEKIEYVHLGRVSSWGVGCGAVTWILIGVLGGMTLVVGIIMFMWNKQRLKHMYATQSATNYAPPAQKASVPSSNKAVNAKSKQKTKKK